MQIACLNYATLNYRRLAILACKLATAFVNTPYSYIARNPENKNLFSLVEYHFDITTSEWGHQLERLCRVAAKQQKATWWLVRVWSYLGAAGQEAKILQSNCGSDRGHTSMS